ncbi:NAD(P)H-binding protein [Nonomuraea sediminis]|uniref:NAD(P)H-binding protein n=1 Tax=Nonomuraea sediminis TaxID=2835864 RepID=UPI001BDC1280|nr:NAD(P)H-binding protein [Nonomuraea sediminis]
MILVTGATGTIGGEVVRLLAGRGERVRAMTRQDVALPGVEVVRGDFDDQPSLDDAVSGVEALFLLSAPGPRIARHDAAMLAAARAAGVRKVVKLSAIGAVSWHEAGEQAVRSGELEWTVLRPSSFASNALRWAPAIRRGDAIQNSTGTGTQGVVDPRDVAEVAVQALTSDAHASRVLTLTGPELVSVPDQVAVLAEVLGRDLAAVDVSPEEYHEQLIAAGMDPAFAETAANGSRLIASGGNARITDDLARALPHPPRTFATWANDHRAAFT